jgi:hypothetical protein
MRTLGIEALAAWAGGALRAAGLDRPDLDGAGVVVPGIFDPGVRPGRNQGVFEAYEKRLAERGAR